MFYNPAAKHFHYKLYEDKDSIFDSKCETTNKIKYTNVNFKSKQKNRHSIHKAKNNQQCNKVIDQHKHLGMRNILKYKAARHYKTILDNYNILKIQI